MDGVAITTQDAALFNFFPDEVEGTEVDHHVADVGAFLQWVQVVEIETYSVATVNLTVAVGTLPGAAFESVDLEPEFFNEFAAVIVTGGTVLADRGF